MSLSGKIKQRAAHALVLIAVGLGVIFFISLNLSWAETTKPRPKNDEIFDFIKETRHYRNLGLAAIHLLYQERYTLTTDHRAIYNEHVATQILSSKGMFASVASFPYHRSLQVKINHARTIQPDGKVIPVDLSTILDQASGSPDSPTDDRQKVINFPSVVIGSVVEYDVAYEFELENLPKISGVFRTPLNWYNLHCRFIVEAPIGMVLKYETARMPDERPDITSTNTHNIYTWQINHFQLSSDSQPFLPEYLRFGPFIAFSTIPDWDSVANAYYDFLFALSKPSEVIKRKVRELKISAQSDPNKTLELISAFIHNKIRPIPTSIPAIKPQMALKTFLDASGNAWDISILFLAMIRAAEIPAYPALIIKEENNYFNRELPWVFFDEMLLALPREGGYRFINPQTGGNDIFLLTPDREDRDGIIVKEGGHFEFIKTPSLLPDQNKTLTTTHITIYDDGFAQLNSATQLSGRTLETFLTKHNAPGQNEKAAGENRQQENIPRFCQRRGKKLIFAIPYEPEAGLAERINAQERILPIVITPYPRTIENQTTIEIPGGYHVKKIPETLYFNMPFIKVRIQLIDGGGQLILRDAVTLLKRDISVENYQHLKIIFEKIEKFYKKKIILEVDDVARSR